MPLAYAAKPQGPKAPFFLFEQKSVQSTAALRIFVDRGSYVRSGLT